MLYQRASQKHGSKEFVIVDCQVDAAAQKCGIDVERLVKQRLRRTSFVSKHIKGSEKTDGGVGKQNEFSNQLTDLLWQGAQKEGVSIHKYQLILCQFT